jgi:hypothetical protein
LLAKSIGSSYFNGGSLNQRDALVENSLIVSNINITKTLRSSPFVVVFFFSCPIVAFVILKMASKGA